MEPKPKECIYVIVAQTVQHPLKYDCVFDSKGHPHHILSPMESTKTVVQPKGRQAAQACHVVSLMRQDILTRSGITFTCQRPAKGKPWPELQKWYDDMRAKARESVTTIIFSVPDSFQLEFYQNLLEKKGINVHTFSDQNDEYGWGHVRTAICTEPMLRDELFGITDYLSLWS